MKRVICILCFIVLSFSLCAEVLTKGSGEVRIIGNKPNLSELSEARKLAIKSALSRWASNQGGSFLNNYISLQQKIETDLKTYILDDSVLTESTNVRNKTYKVIVRVLIDDIRIRNLIIKSSSVVNTAQGDKSYMTFIFLARRQKSVKSFADRAVVKQVRDATEKGEEIDNGESEYSVRSQTINKLTSGGSTLKQADEILYNVVSSDEVNIAMSEIFSSSGFEIVDAEYLEAETEGLISLSAFKSDYSNGDDITSKTKSNAAKGAKMVDVPYMAIGTLDIGMKMTDSATGLIRVPVKLTGKVVSVQKRFPKTVAAVGPEMISGIGPSQTQAESNALKFAARRAAQELVNQLNSKNIN